MKLENTFSASATIWRSRKVRHGFVNPQLFWRAGATSKLAYYLGVPVKEG